MTSLKTPLFVIFFIFICLFLYTKFAGPIPFYVNSVQTTKTDLFTANGTGKVTAVPDVALVNMAVTKNALTVADAQNQTNTVIKAITDALQKAGIDAKSIKTTDYSINPQYDQDGKTITSYQVVQSLEITAEPIAKVNTVIDAATANGANIVGSTQFTFADDTKKKLLDEARQQAVADAKNSAQSLAGAAGIHLGAIVNVQENASTPEPIQFNTPLTLKAAGSSGTPTDITPGENTVTTSVTLSYATY